MGAAIAQIAALDDVLNNGNQNTKVITFGGPRVFSKGAAILYNSTILGENTIRAVKEGDIVPKVPPEGLYIHAGGYQLDLPGRRRLPSGYLKKLEANLNQEMLDNLKNIIEKKEPIVDPKEKEFSVSGYLHSAVELTSNVFQKRLHEVDSKILNVTVSEATQVASLPNDSPSRKSSKSELQM